MKPIINLKICPFFAKMQQIGQHILNMVKYTHQQEKNSSNSVPSSLTFTYVGSKVDNMSDMLEKYNINTTYIFMDNTRVLQLVKIY